MQPAPLQPTRSIVGALVAGWLLVIVVQLPASGHELGGFVGVEGRLFSAAPAFPGQRQQSGSLVLAPEYYHAAANGLAFTLTPFLRLDSADDQRRHADLRECFLLYPAPHFDLRAGIAKVFWGSTEFVHLVDIINQTDLIEDVDGEEKLGQPMLQLTVPGQWGSLDLFVLPGFRERTFAGRHGRLRPSLLIHQHEARYESGAEQRHIDCAVRYSRTVGDADLGFSWFRGTSREPDLLAAMDAGGPYLVPYYPQIRQSSVDGQWVTGEWLWKWEGLHRSGQGDGYYAATGGFEYTLVGVGGSAMDLGLIGEYAWDERRRRSPSFAENDLLAGVRLAVNDQAGSELLLGVAQDLDSPGRLVSVEASRRLGEVMKLSLEGRFFIQPEDGSPLAPLAADDFIRLELLYYL